MNQDRSLESVPQGQVAGTITPVFPASDSQVVDGSINVGDKPVDVPPEPVANQGIIEVKNPSSDVHSIANNVVSELSTNSSQVQQDSVLNFDLPSSLESSSSQSISTNSNSIDTSHSSTLQQGVIPVSVNSVVPNDGNTDIPSLTTDVNAGGSITPVVAAQTDSIISEQQNLSQVTPDMPESVTSHVQNSNDSISFGQYMGYMFITLIPVVGLVFLIKKTMDREHKSISNFAKAQLVFYIILSLIFIIFTSLFFNVMGNFS